MLAGPEQNKQQYQGCGTGRGPIGVTGAREHHVGERWDSGDERPWETDETPVGRRTAPTTQTQKETVRSSDREGRGERPEGGRGDDRERGGRQGPAGGPEQGTGTPDERGKDGPRAPARPSQPNPNTYSVPSHAPVSREASRLPGLSPPLTPLATPLHVGHDPPSHIYRLGTRSYQDDALR
ncbi:hypothetical protein EMCRGX_G033321 [Ephydatia muelleri]